MVDIIPPNLFDKNCLTNNVTLIAILTIHNPINLNFSLVLYQFQLFYYGRGLKLGLCDFRSRCGSDIMRMLKDGHGVLLFLVFDSLRCLKTK